jgi:hypothetical protein
MTPNKSRKCEEEYLDLFYVIANQTVTHLNCQADSNGNEIGLGTVGDHPVMCIMTSQSGPCYL